MNLLIASGLSGIKESIEFQLTTSNEGEVDYIHYVETAKDIMDSLSAKNYDFVITGYIVDGIDVWKLSKLINSSRHKSGDHRLIIIKETCEIEIPSILAKEYKFSIESLDNIIHTLNSYKLESNPSSLNSLLIIEDDEDASITARHALQDIYDVDYAIDGEAGYDLWLKKRHDLILLDLMLPKMSGEEVLDKIMTLNNNQSVIIVTAINKTEIQNKLLINGASEYLCKPFSLTDLRLLCQALLNKSKLFHQQQYLDEKINKIRNDVWLIEYAMTLNKLDDAKKILTSLKHSLPNNLTEDEKINLIAAGF